MTISIEQLSKARAAGYSDEQIAQELSTVNPRIREAISLGHNPTAILRELATASDRASVQRALMEDTDNPGDVLTGRVTTRIGQGIKQLGLEGAELLNLAPEGVADEYGEMIAREESLVAPLRQEYPVADVASQIAGEAPTFAIGGGPNLVRRALTGPAVDLGLAGVQPGSAEERFRRMGYAAPVSMVGFGIGEGGGLLNRAVGEAPTWRQELINFGKSEGIPIYYPDVAGGTSRMMSERVLSEVPLVGTGTRYRAQRDDISQRYQELPSRVAKSGTDVSDEAIQASMQRRYRAVNARAGELYDRVERLACNTAVDTPRFKMAVQNALDAERAQGSLADPGIINTLTEWLEAPSGNFAHARKVRSGVRAENRAINEMLSTSPGAAKVKQRGTQMYPELQDALEADMRAFTDAAGGDLARLDRQADAFYKTNKVQRYTASSKAGGATVGMKPVRSNLPENAWKGFLKAKGPKAAREYVAAFDLRGKESARRRLMEEILDTASGVTDEGVEYISPAMFRRTAGKYNNQLDALFPGKGREILRGYENLGGIMRNVSKHGAMPLTGYDLRKLGSLLGVPAVVGALGAKTAGLPGVLLGAVGVSGLSQLLTTEGGRDFIIALSKLRTGDFARISRLLTTAGTRGGALLGAEFGPEAVQGYQQYQNQQGALDQE